MESSFNYSPKVETRPARPADQYQADILLRMIKVMPSLSFPPEFARLAGSIPEGSK
jgi:hypothetical protein